MIVKIADFRTCGICPRARLWFEEHGLSWRGFVKDGIEVDILRATGCHIDLWNRVEAAAVFEPNDESPWV